MNTPSHNNNVTFYRFKLACYYGRCSEAIQLYLKDKTIDVNWNNCYAFRRACKLGYINLAKFLYSLGADIYGRNNIAFRHACCYGHLEIAKWLYSIDVNTYSKEAIKWACAKGRFAVVKWLCSVDTNNFNSVKAFKFACYNKHFQIARWLSNRNPRLIAECLNEEYLINTIMQKIKLPKQTSTFLKRIIQFDASNTDWSTVTLDILDDIYYIDEIGLHTLCIYNIDSLCELVTKKFPHIIFEYNDYPYYNVIGYTIQRHFYDNN